MNLEMNAADNNPTSGGPDVAGGYNAGAAAGKEAG